MPKTTKSSKAKPAQSNQLNTLNKWNKILAGLFLVQALVILIVSKSVGLPVNTSYLTLDTLATKATGHQVMAIGTRHLFDINGAYLLAAFLIIAGLANLVVATYYRAGYEKDLKKGINKARWLGYGLASGLMIVTIGLLSGVNDLSLLIAIFSLTGLMSLVSWGLEYYGQNSKNPNWWGYLVACKAGFIPWLVLAIYVWGTNVYGSGQIAGYVYWIYATIFVLSLGFAVNTYMRYRGQGKWADYLYTEKAYMLLSLATASLLAWQVFFGILKP